eukprot:scaffold12145_cov101-Isochrysis_galbana.AAC.4
MVSGSHRLGVRGVDSGGEQCGEEEGGGGGGEREEVVEAGEAGRREQVAHDGGKQRPHAPVGGAGHAAAGVQERRGARLRQAQVRGTHRGHGGRQEDGARHKTAQAVGTDTCEECVGSVKGYIKGAAQDD